MQAMTDMGGDDAHSPCWGMEAVFRRYYPKLCYYAFKIIDNKASAEDVVQDGCLTDNFESRMIAPWISKGFFCGMIFLLRLVKY
jgi:hypothetical protein